MSRNVLLCLCGSINSINITHYIIELKSKYDEVNILASGNGKKFVNANILKQFCDNYYDEAENPFLNHIDISKKHEKVLIIPATANTINKIANGICDNLLLTICHTSFDKLYIFPNMNLLMWENPITKKNIDKLKNYGISIYPSNIRNSFEISSRTMKKNVVMPDPHEVLDFILKRR
ncbi:enterotoxin (plasmid) [Staphylococcus agnetis]|uniref:HyiD n=1 Tax=Staphylococcus hyicus TaxID=1284 RepID=A0A1V0JZC5_STAHY|nr:MULTISPECIES: flavoprotein [Staphylococcus]ARD24448.1 HyiD [Staphylococcus hyicus]NHM74039.1 enterotoxin [Staphylococcus sp. 11007852]TRW80372.1 enterotoxin [Staphylococcus agnetis]